jgi:membrane-bound inhibitor of C-type lysozyme
MINLRALHSFWFPTFWLPKAALLVALPGLSACLTTPDTENRWEYVCTDGYHFKATYDRKDRHVLLDDGSQELKLENLKSASGGRYSNGTIDLWTKGALAFIKEDGEVLHPDCTGVSI